MHYILVFNTRNATFAFSKKLSARGIESSVISTPKNLGRSCSLSVKLSEESHRKARDLIARAGGDIYKTAKLP